MACGVLSQEEQLLTRFFETARLHDTTLLAKYATITFNPRTEGVVQDFAVESVDQIDDASKRVRVRADIRSLDTGVVRPRSLIVTMRRQGDRWMITELRGAP